MSKGKRKGSGFEREIAKYLTKWLTGQNKEYYFWRSPGSGSIATITEQNKDITGDIIGLKKESLILLSKFSIECKVGYPGLTIDNHLKDLKTNLLKTFWVQANNDAQKAIKSPMLIYKKKNFKDPWLGITKEIYDKLYKYIKKLRFIHIRWNDLPELYIMNLYEFFDIIDKEKIKELNV